MQKLILLIVVLLAVCYAAPPAADEVTTLPGWNGTLKSKMYAGFVDAGSRVDDGVTYELMEHYIFFESENDPVNDPLIVWTNGGPGADSYFGLFTELGPYYVDGSSIAGKNRSETPTLYSNEKGGWNKNASMVILNSPPPVGFSYCKNANGTGQTGKGDSCGTHNDTTTATQSAVFLENWIAIFDNFQNNTGGIYITGESYAGVYVPTLVRKILQNTSSLVGANLKGFAVGDGCVGTEVLCSFDGKDGPGPWYDLMWMAGHNQMPAKVYAEVLAKCDNDLLKGYPPVPYHMDA
jgi:serine carboxypeptidase-like clade 1